MWKVVPETIGIFRNGVFNPNAPVLRVVAHPPGQHPKGAPVVSNLTALEIITESGSRWYGVQRAVISSRLRMMVELHSGAERDEVVRKWPNLDTLERQHVERL